MERVVTVCFETRNQWTTFDELSRHWLGSSKENTPGTQGSHGKFEGKRGKKLRSCGVGHVSRRKSSRTTSLTENATIV